MGKNPPIENEEGLPPGIQEVDGYRFDFNGWTLGDLLDYNHGVSNGDLLGLINVLSKTITEWPLESSPNNVESFRRITLIFWKKEVLPRMFRAVAKEFSKSDSAGDDSNGEGQAERNAPGSGKLCGTGAACQAVRMGRVGSV